MTKTLRDYLLKGGIKGKSFVFVKPSYSISHYLNKPYKVESLSCDNKGRFGLDVHFYHISPYKTITWISLETSLDDIEATQKQIKLAKKRAKVSYSF